VAQLAENGQEFDKKAEKWGFGKPKIF